MPENKAEIGWVYIALERATRFTFGVAIPASFIFLLGALVAGLVQLFFACKILAWPWFSGESTGTSLKDSIQSTIHALELFILAPLPYVVLHGLYRYLRRDMKNEHSVGESSGLPEVKAIVASILVSTVAVNLVGDVLKGESLSWDRIGMQLATIIVLASYFVIMELVARMKAGHGSISRASLGLAHQPPDTHSPAAE
ncbi:MAG TPA: hypothetical protein VEW71_04130 [Allosphingosinicella sp.]|nr:hypothetical protein [Allosphingosinicella sp.]